MLRHPRSLVVAVLTALLLVLAGVASASAAVYTGRDAAGRARITLGTSSVKITLSARNARRAAHRPIRLQCGKGSYGIADLYSVLWPDARTRTVTAPEPTGFAAVDRCRIRLGQGTTIIAKMTMRKA